MVVQSKINDELWEMIKKNYKSENYTGVILDSVFKLTDTIRNKSGLEGDGASLIGQAFGGENPKIKLNKLQTDSEKNVQKGIQDILRGIYISIRNPRSHDAINDKKEDADSIIIFINYLLDLIDKSKSSFEEDEFLNRIFDIHYVRSTEYSDLLVKEIPKRQRVNIAISIILKRKHGEKHTLKSFFESLFSKLKYEELLRVYKIIGDELKLLSNKEDISTLIHICPGKHWKMLDKSVRLRIEEILFDDLSNATYDAIADVCGPEGWLATWITADHLENFNNLGMWTREIIGMLESNDDHLIKYINNYYWDSICKSNRTNIVYPLEEYITKGLKNKDEEIIEKLTTEIIWDKHHPWWGVFKEELELYPDIEPDPIGIPF